MTPSLSCLGHHFQVAVLQLLVLSASLPLLFCHCIKSRLPSSLVWEKPCNTGIWHCSLLSAHFVTNQMNFFLSSYQSHCLFLSLCHMSFLFVCFSPHCLSECLYFCPCARRTIKTLEFICGAPPDNPS